MQLSLERQVALGFALALVALLLTSAGTLWSIARFESAFGSVDHTHRVRNSLEQILIQALNVQTGSRGYALSSGDPQFLQPYERGLAEIRTHLAETRRLVADNPAQQTRFSKLEHQIDALVSATERRNELLRTGRLAAPLSDELLEAGKRAMDAIRQLIDEMTAHEAALLDQRTGEARRSAATTRLVFLLTLAGILALAAYAGTRVQREFAARQQADRALQRSAEEIRDLYNRAPCGYHSLDERGTIIEINDTELEWLGYARDEIAGRMSFADLLTPEAIPVYRQNFPRFKETGRIDNLEFELRRKDGSTFCVSLSATAIYDERGRYVQSRSTLHDITERRAAEQRLERLHAELQRRADELEAVNRELEAFSYSASHDLRAPLRHMAGFAALLGQLPATQTDAEAQRYVGIITGSATKMGQLIDDLLAFSRLGRTTLSPTSVDSTALVRSLVQENLFTARPDTRWHIDPLPPVHADLSLLTQVWLNLLSNAVKYSRHAEPPEIRITSRTDRSGTVFTVRDNGVGFDPSYADKLFRVFSRLHPESQFGGTGVGLALVERIVTRHGGRVWAESEPGRGAAFSFSLPSIPPVPHANRPPSDPPR